jgi:SAM-dependent methyltransferase
MVARAGRGLSPRRGGAGMTRLIGGLLRRIEHLNERHPWSHNDHYHRWLLRQIPPHVRSVLDVGCGTGNLARALTSRADMVLGVDSDPIVIAAARSNSAQHPNLQFQEGKMTALPDRKFAVVTAVAMVHHADLAEALGALRRATAPGGRILIIGCYRAATALDYAFDVVAIPANIFMGLANSRGAAQARQAMSAPTAAPTTTLAEIRQVAALGLPGVRIRRRLFWRYTLAYTAPGQTA